MEKTEVKISSIFVRKSKFFTYRIFTYFSFLLLPVWVQKAINLPQFVQVPIMALYIIFMIGQWFLLGKEIDHRLKIYYKQVSSIDRVIYRLLLGMLFMVIYFNLLSFLPNKWLINTFWTTWGVLGLFYSWPTRGRIIQESMSSSFSEYRYLDSFEKTLLLLSFIFFVVSIPSFPSLVNVEALKLFFDPGENFHSVFWNFLKVNYLPFQNYPGLFKLSWCLHFYLVGAGLFLVVFYAFLRYFFSRRSSLLGVFALISSWSFSKILEAEYGASISATYSLLWVWSILWVNKSSTYRTGLFLGLVNFLGVLINPAYILLFVAQLFMTNFYMLNDKTKWFKKQLLRYQLPGMILCVVLVSASMDKILALEFLDTSVFEGISGIIRRKGFFSLSIVGVLIFILSCFRFEKLSIQHQHIEKVKFHHLLLLITALFFMALIVDVKLMTSLSAMWVVTLLSLLPLELIFYSISRLRSKRNLIYLTYILVCLLDSHFEGRIKILYSLFQ
jgi:hypothetical protein